MIKVHQETCFTCEKRSNCRAEYTINKQQHPVQCVWYQRETDTKLIYHDNHRWEKASENYSHMNGVSNLAWCTKCGAEGCSSAPPSNRCYDVVILKKYRVGGIYAKENKMRYL